MKGFKDSKGKFRPTENKRGIRMKRDTSKDGVKIKSVTLTSQSVKKVATQQKKNIDKGETGTFSGALNDVIGKSRLKRITHLTENEINIENLDGRRANELFLKIGSSVKKIYPSAKSESVMLTAKPFQDTTSFLHTWETSNGDIVFQAKFSTNDAGSIDASAKGDIRVFDEVFS